MIIIIWEYQVKADRVAEFEHIYSSNGTWAELFRKAQGYQGTELLRDLSDLRHYITIDRWDTAEHYELFLSQRKIEYAELDAQCEGLTERESLAGTWESFFAETR
ncbi:MAG: antibiotic biosynthesis monooxygenase family protein [Anaerolineales bacterium]